MRRRTAVFGALVSLVGLLAQVHPGSPGVVGLLTRAAVAGAGRNRRRLVDRASVIQARLLLADGAGLLIRSAPLSNGPSRWYVA